MPQDEIAKQTYDRYAPIYDEANAANDYEMWLGDLLIPALERYGLRGEWALDVGCGTGRAFEPLLKRGWKLVGCDISTGMLAEAKRKYGAQVELLALDARDLPLLSPPASDGFHLILLLNDVVNYMTGDRDLESAFASVKRNLAANGGLVVFDCNTESTLRSMFASGISEQMSARGWEWRGLTHEPKAGIVHEARLSGSGVDPHIHRQRHWTIEQVTAALNSSGLRCLATLGQHEEDGRVILHDTPTEERDHKLIYIASESK